MTTLGTPNLWPLLTGGRCSEVGSRFKLELQNAGRCGKVVDIRSWSLAQILDVLIMLTLPMFSLTFLSLSLKFEYKLVNIDHDPKFVTVVDRWSSFRDRFM